MSSDNLIIVALVIITATFVATTFLTGCTPRTGLEHEYHVASITINGERTETDFLLCRARK